MDLERQTLLWMGKPRWAADVLKNSCQNEPYQTFIEDLEVGVEVLHRAFHVMEIKAIRINYSLLYFSPPHSPRLLTLGKKKSRTPERINSK